MKKYDVIIIGGGLGGLTSGVMLSKEGLSVCVLEKHSVIGGCLQSFKRNGYTLDTGMHYVGSLSEGQIMHQYFKYLGVMNSLKLRKLDENGFDHFHFSDGSSFCHAMGYEKFIGTLVSNFPHEKDGLCSFARTLQYVGRLITPEILREGKISNGGIGYMSISAYKEIEKHIKDEKLRRVLAGNCGLYAGNSLSTSLYEYGMITHSNIEGAYAFEDGSQQLADLLANEIKSYGGDIFLSAKVSSVVETIQTYRILAEKTNCPLHLGVTEAGTARMGLIKSSAGIGSLLMHGIGDTIRVSLTDDPVNEVYAGHDILKALGLKSDSVQIVSCPTCGRTKIDLIGVANEVENALRDCTKKIKVAVMGCVVNGPGEAREADIGIAGGDGCAMLFKKGEILRKIDEKDIVRELLAEIEKL